MTSRSSGPARPHRLGVVARLGAPVAVLALVLAVVVGCGSPRVGPRISASGTPHPAPTTTTAVPSPSPSPSRLDLGPAPEDLRRHDWERAQIPGEFCGIRGKISLAKETHPSQKWGPVHVGFLASESGQLLDTPSPEVAVSVYCDNGGGTGSSTLQYGMAILASEGDRLVSLGTVTPQRSPPNVLPSLIADVRWHLGRLEVTESWYRPSDGTCCPSGSAVTSWRLQSGELTPGPTRVTG